MKIFNALQTAADAAGFSFSAAAAAAAVVAFIFSEYFYWIFNAHAANYKATRAKKQAMKFYTVRKNN